MATSRAQAEKSESSEEEETLLAKDPPKPPPRRKEILWTISMILVALNLVVQILVLFKTPCGSQRDKICSAFTSQYASPIDNDVKIKYQTVDFNGSFQRQTIYRGAAGPEADAAWEALGVDYNPIIVPEKDAQRYGLAAGQVKRRKDQGGGFFANVEVLHHLHCLNLLRKVSHWSYDYYHYRGEGAFANEDDILRLHFSHCLDILRQQIMCTADTAIFAQHWIADPPGPFVDFNRKHKCKNFEEIREWAKKNQVLDADDDEVEFREGDLVLPEIP